VAKRKFKTEVNQLLELIIHSLYSHPEVFLRELVSNASDALDKLKYLTLTDDAYKGLKLEPSIDISFDEDKQTTLTVTDTGIGMNEEDLETNLGTIARSGTREFVQKLSGDAKKDSNLIGQFGVGFYSSFMVADQVEVVTRKAGEDTAWRWTSDGKGGFEIAEGTRAGYGTTVTLHLNEAGKEYASRWQIENIVKKYSNHIPYPIVLHYTETKKDKKTPAHDRVNAASALWRRPKAELTDRDYGEFYRGLSHDDDDPLLTIHTRAEGTLEYTTLFFVPKKAPFDLFFMNYRAAVKLYIKRVFITDDDKELMPQYLRFVRGIIDSEDLPLNVSREMLQKNRTLASIRSASVKKILTEIETLKVGDRAKYAEFWTEFRKPMKEGLYQDYANRDALLELVMWKTTNGDGYTTLTEYKDRMKADQKVIYYVAGENEANLRASPLLEAYRKRGIEVLVMDDEIDEIVLPAVGRYKDFEFRAVNRKDAADDLKSDEDKKTEKEAESLASRIKKALGDSVKDVRASTRLEDSPCCVVADETDPSIQMQHILKAMGQEGPSDVKPILEFNPRHAIVKKLEALADGGELEDASRLLLDQALLLEGAKLADMPGFVKRLNRVLEKSL
jgi:molecular chaperone HtpG